MASLKRNGAGPHFDCVVCRQHNVRQCHGRKPAGAGPANKTAATQLQGARRGNPEKERDPQQRDHPERLELVINGASCCQQVNGCVTQLENEHTIGDSEPERHSTEFHCLTACKRSCLLRVPRPRTVRRPSISAFSTCLTLACPCRSGLPQALCLVFACDGAAESVKLRAHVTTRVCRACPRTKTGIEGEDEMLFANS